VRPACLQCADSVFYLGKRHNQQTSREPVDLSELFQGTSSHCQLDMGAAISVLWRRWVAH
jgi:hypothetical protein